MASEVKDIRRELDLSSVCDGNMTKLLTSHFQAVGVPKEYVFFPLLSTVSSFLGGSTVKINDEWTEACCLWTAVVARKGSRRSTVLERFTAAIHDTKNQSVDNATPSKINIIYDDEIPKDTLQGKVDTTLGLFEDLSTPCITEKDIMHQSKKSYDIKPSKNSNRGHLNIFSFLSPEDALALLDDKNIDLSSRFLVACPKSSLFKCADMKTPMPSNTPSLARIFDVLSMVHAEPMTYELSTQAKCAFNAYYDVLQDGMLRFDKDERNYCILSKAAGQLARLCVCLTTLKQALNAVVYRETVSPANWNVEISTEDIEAGKVIMDYVIDIRFTLLNRVSSFKSQSMYSIGNTNQQTSPVNLGSMFLPQIPREQGEPTVKRLRVASADPGHGQINGHQHTPATTSTVQRGPASQSAVESSQTPPISKGPNHAISSPLPGFHSTFTTSVGQRAPQGKVTNYVTGEIPGASFFSGGSVEDEEYYLPGRRNSSYVDCTTLSPSDLEGFNEEQQRFIRRFGYKVKKLLLYRADYRISPSCCSQRHLMPPIPKSEMAKYDTQTRYPVVAAKEYLAKIADLGFGIIESTWHATNNRKSLIFQKFPYDKLRASTRNLLAKLEVNADEYMAAFTVPSDNMSISDNTRQMFNDSYNRQLSPNVTSSSASFPVPYTFLQQNQLSGQAGVHMVFPENPDDSSETSPVDCEPIMPNQFFPKTEPTDGLVMDG